MRHSPSKSENITKPTDRRDMERTKFNEADIHTVQSSSVIRRGSVTEKKKRDKQAINEDS